MRMRLMIAALMILVAGTGMFAQERPNFSGQWVLDKPGPQTVDATHEYSVKHDARTFSVGHDAGHHMQAYSLDGQAHELTMTTTSIHNVKSIGKATWDGNKLLLERTDDYASGLTRTLKQVWSLDNTGLLTVESSNVTSAGESTNTKYAYKRRR